MMIPILKREELIAQQNENILNMVINVFTGCGL